MLTLHLRNGAKEDFTLGFFVLDRSKDLVDHSFGELNRLCLLQLLFVTDPAIQYRFNNLRGDDERFAVEQKFRQRGDIATEYMRVLTAWICSARALERIPLMREMWREETTQTAEAME